MKDKEFVMMVSGHEYARTKARDVKAAWKNLRVANRGICGVISPHRKESQIRLARGNMIETVTATLIES